MCVCSLCSGSAAGGGVDYTASNMGFTISMNFTDNDTRCLDVTILEDPLVEGDETFTVTLTLLTPGLGVTTGDDITAVAVTDNEGKLV